MRNFKQLLIWQKGFQIAVNSIKFVAAFPKEEKYGISSQISRAAVSIPSNIAEGSSRTSMKDYNRFLEISLGSTFELETQLILALKFKYITQEQMGAFEEIIRPVQKMAFGLYNSLQK